jgi:hypothetical protein
MKNLFSCSVLVLAGEVCQPGFSSAECREERELAEGGLAPMDIFWISLSL